jgi:hypothetical protein
MRANPRLALMLHRARDTRLAFGALRVVEEDANRES